MSLFALNGLILYIRGKNFGEENGITCCKVFQRKFQMQKILSEPRGFQWNFNKTQRGLNMFYFWIRKVFAFSRGEKISRAFMPWFFFPPVLFYVQSMQNHLVPSWRSWIFSEASTFYCTINQRLHGNIHLIYSKHNFTYRCACCAHISIQEAVSTCIRIFLFGNTRIKYGLIWFTENYLSKKKSICY